MTARDAINNIRGMLSYKACFFYVLVSGATLFFTFLVYYHHGYAPIVWSGTCAPSEPGKETAYVTCDVDGRKVSDSISLKMMYRVMKDNKPLMCDVDTLDNVTCKAGE